MHMFQPSMRDGQLGLLGMKVVEMGMFWIWSLDTAVKDGGFGWGCWSWCRLKKIIEELDLSKVPSVFICPTIRVLQMRMSVILIF